MDRSDKALLAAFLFSAILGVLTHCLLLNDGAVLLSAGWLGDAWDLYFNQLASRILSVLVTFGPAWAMRAAFGLDAGAYMTLAHVLYFAVPLVFWLILRAMERERIFSRLYLALVLVLMTFPSELIVGLGLWLIWLILVTDPLRSTRGIVVATLLLGVAMAFTHPAVALTSLVFLLAGLFLPLFGRRLPTRLLVASGALAALELAAYFIASHWLSPSNPTVVAALDEGRYRFIDPIWMVKTIVLYPALAALWFLLLVPGAEVVRLRWRSLPTITVIVGLFGLWCAVTGTGLQSSLYARHTGAYIMAVALVLALASKMDWPEDRPRKDWSRIDWPKRAERPLMLFAAIAAAGALSYNVDLFLFGRFVDRDMAPGVKDAASVPEPWPSRRPEPLAALVLFKYGANGDYVRDVVMPTYDWFRVTLAFYTFFRSDRQSVLFHPLGDGSDWQPFECPAVARALNGARDAQDKMFLDLVARHYCAP